MSRPRVSRCLVFRFDVATDLIRLLKFLPPHWIANFEVPQQSFASTKALAALDAPQGQFLEMNEPRVFREFELIDEVLVTGYAFPRVQIAVMIS